MTLAQSVQPNAAIRDFQTTTSTLTLGEASNLSALRLDLDLAHTWRGDLVVKLTSPSGRSVTVSDRQGGSADDLRGTFDFSAAFKGEAAQGDWTLTVEDRGRRDEGVLRSWGLEAVGEKTVPEEQVTPVAISEVLQRYGWPPEAWQADLLRAADAQGNRDGSVTVGELDAYLADPDDLKFLTSTAMQEQRAAVSAAGGIKEVSSFEEGWQKSLAERADTDGDGRLNATELDSYLMTVKAGSASVESLWMPDQKAAPFGSRIADLTGEADFLTPNGMPAGAVLLSKDYMRISHDSDRRVPQWVSYQLTAADVAEKTETKRKSYFKKDPELGDNSPNHDDYTRSGFDRGHHKPARDSVNQEAMDESFLISNVTPQVPDLNQRSWMLLEQATWELVQATGGKASIFTGGLFLDAEGNALPPEQSSWIGPDGQQRVGVPTHLYKAVLLTHPDGTQQTYAYLTPNEAGKGGGSQLDQARFLAASRVSVDRIEELVGQDLFGGLEDSLEQRLEADPTPAIEFSDRGRWKAANLLWPAASS